MNPIAIEQLSQNNFPQAQDFYQSVGYFSPIQPSDLVIGAYDAQKIIGIVRIAFEENTAVLRGMMIDLNHQRQGIGTHMLQKLEKYIGMRECFCLAHDWLENFYGQIRFFKISEIEAPVFLQKRLVENKKTYPHLIIMRRDPISV